MTNLKKYDDYIQFQMETSESFHTWFNLAIIVKEKAPFNRNEIVGFLKSNGIETRPIIAGNMV